MSMNVSIKVTYDPKMKRLVMNAPFFLNDVLRGFPSRRFDPKGKTWKMPLTTANIKHLEGIRHRYDFSLSPESSEAIRQIEELTRIPDQIPFPQHLYSFARATVPYEPLGHQWLMLNMAWNLPAVAWFARMGTGKTFSTIHLACARFKGGLITRLGIIAPSTLAKTWQKEFAKYATVECDIRVHKTKDAGYEKWSEPATDRRGVLKVLIISAEGLGVSEQMFQSACLFVRGDVMLAADESSRFKNPKALRTQRAIQMGGCAKYRLILNGTPIALGIQDLWAQYEFLDPNILGMGDYWAFKTHYLEMGGYEQKQIVGYKHLDELMEKIKPFTIEVSKDVLNLPPKVPKTHWLEATAEQRRLFKMIAKGMDTETGVMDVKVDNTLERMLRCRQVAGGWYPKMRIELSEVDGVPCEVKHTDLIPLKENPKMEDLFATIEANYAGSKFIIWSTFRHEIEYIINRLRDTYGDDSVAGYYGGVDKETRSLIEDRYCNSPSLRFFVGNPVAAGLGLTLISGENDVMYYYSGTNAFIDRSQSEDRAHRIGTVNPVVIIDAVIEKSVDEIIQESIQSKLDIDQYVAKCMREGRDIVKILAGES